MRLFILIFFVIAWFLIIKFLFKITSSLLKLLVWVIIFSFGVYIINYFVLPKFNKTPYNIDTKIVNPAVEFVKSNIPRVKKNIFSILYEIENFARQKISRKNRK